MSVSPRELLLRRTSVPNPEEHHWDEIRSSELLSSYADLDNLVNSLVFRTSKSYFLAIAGETKLPVRQRQCLFLSHQKSLTARLQNDGL